MPLTRVYSSDPGDDVLLGSGPALNVIEVATQNAKNARGRGIGGVVGSVVNDRGLVNQALVLENGLEDIFGRYGGFKSWMGDGIAAPGSAAGYGGNLAAVAWKLSAPAIRLVIPDMAIKNTSVDVLVSFDRTAPTAEATLPAGFRIDDGSGYTLATLEDVYWAGTDATDKTVRMRQVGAGTPVAINTVTTLVDTPGDATIAVSTVAVTVPEDMTVAEVELRYEAAFDAINDSLPGQQITEIACDRTEATLLDSLSAHCATSTGVGFWRRGYVGPPISTDPGDARTGGADSADRAGLTQARVMYGHPCWTRSFPLDSASLTAPEYSATFAASGIVDMCRVLQERPEQNPGRPHQMLKTWGATGLESLSGGTPDLATHWAANISQRIFERGIDGAIQASFHDAIMADGTKVADRRMRDYLQEALILAVRPYHKTLATKANRDAAVNSVVGLLRTYESANDPSRARIGPFSVTSIWDAANNHLRIKCVITLLGNMDVVTLHVDAQTSNADVVIEEAA